MECEKYASPMCSICLCEHNQQVHETNSVHISALVLQKLPNACAHMTNLDEQQSQLREFTKGAEESEKLKEKIKAAAEFEINKGIEFWKMQDLRMKERNDFLNKEHDKIKNEINRVSKEILDKAKDPKTIEEKIKALIAKQDYWQAYKEIEWAIDKDSNKDDKIIQAMLKKYSEMLIEFEKENKQTALKFTQESIMYQKLVQENEANVGIFLI